MLVWGRGDEGEMSNGRILVVEDQPDVQLTMRLSLEMEGYEVALASTADEAVTALEGSTPDLVLLDITLPRVSGWELLERLRADQRFATLPIVVVSALPGEGIARRAADLGANGFLAKPFDVVELGAAVQRALATDG